METLVLTYIYVFHCKRWSLKKSGSSEPHPLDLPLSAVDPGNRDVLQKCHHGERQTGRVIVKHGDEVVSWWLHKQQAQQKGSDAADHWEREEKKHLGGLTCVLQEKVTRE